MSSTLDPQVADALAPIAAAMAGVTPPPVGDVATRRAALERLIAHTDTAQPTPTMSRSPITTRPPPTARRSCCAGTPATTLPPSPARPPSTCTAAA